MLQDLLGTQLDLPVRVGVAVVVIAVLLGLTVLIVRKLSGQGHTGGGKGRQARLAVLDSVAVDQRRRLVLVRRDEVEHLLLIGGASDVLVENGINRAAHRETLVAREAATVRDALPGREPAHRDALPPREANPARRAPPLAPAAAPLGLEARSPVQDPIVEPALAPADHLAPIPVSAFAEKAPVVEPPEAASPAEAPPLEAPAPDTRALPPRRPAMRSAADLFPRVSRTSRPADSDDIPASSEATPAPSAPRDAPEVAGESATPVGVTSSPTASHPVAETAPGSSALPQTDTPSGTGAEDQVPAPASRPLPQPRRGVSPFPVGERDPRAPRTEPRIGARIDGMAARLETSLGRSLERPGAARPSDEGLGAPSIAPGGQERPPRVTPREPLQGTRVRPFSARPADRFTPADVPGQPALPAERPAAAPTAASRAGMAALVTGTVTAASLAAAETIRSEPAPAPRADAAPRPAEPLLAAEANSTAPATGVHAPEPDATGLGSILPETAIAPEAREPTAGPVAPPEVAPPAAVAPAPADPEPVVAAPAAAAPAGATAPTVPVRSEPVFAPSGAPATHAAEPELPPEPQLFAPAEPVRLDDSDLVRELEMTLALELASVHASADTPAADGQAAPGGEAVETRTATAALDQTPSAPSEAQAPGADADPAPETPVEPTLPEKTLSQMFEDAVLAQDDLLNADLTPPPEPSEPAAQAAQAEAPASEPEPEPVAAAHDPFEDLEAEMASLLGRTAPPRTGSA